MNYKNKLFFQSDSADPVVVASNVITPDINAVFGTWGTISGTVKDTDTSGVLSGIQVSVCDTNGAVLAGIPTVVTDVNGKYIVGLVPPGSYKVKFTGANYMDQTSDWTVTPTDGNDTLAPTALLTRAQITGRVTNLVGAGIGGVTIYLYNAGNTNFYPGSTYSTTQSDGTYKIGGLTTGQCRVRFDTSNIYITQFYNNKTTLPSADIVTISTGSTSSNINATLTATSSVVTVNTFTIPSPSSSLTVTAITVTASATNGVSGYCLTETNNGSSCTPWSATAPTSYTFATGGSKTLYAFAKDGANNVSAGRNAPVNIVLPPVTLTTTLDGSGSGSVNALSGITATCASPSTSCPFNNVTYGTPITLSATESLGSSFGGWSACDVTSGTNNTTCSITMNGDKTVSATFNVLPYLKNETSGIFYGTLQSALDTAQADQALRALAMQMLDDTGINFNTGNTVYFHGGYNALTDSSPSGFTAVSGPVKISSGSLVVDRLVIK